MTSRGSFAVVYNQATVLLVLLPEWADFGGHWNFPGGVVEADESLEHAAEREVLEETGVACKVSKHITTVQNHDRDIEVSIFMADYGSGDIKIQQEEITAAQWFGIDEALKLPLAYEIRSILENMI